MQMFNASFENFCIMSEQSLIINKKLSSAIYHHQIHTQHFVMFV